MRFRLVKWILVLAVSAGATNEARADLTLAIGTKWLPLNYTVPVSTTGTTATRLSGFNSTNLDNYVGAFILDGRLGFLLGLDFGYSSSAVPLGGTTTNLSYTQFGLSVGGKYYLTRPARERVVPYVYLDFYKYFAFVSTSAPVPKGSEDFFGGLASPLGIDAAVGAEYFFTPSFSLGAEVLGLKYAYAAGTQQAGTGFGATSATTTNHYVAFYTGVSLNFRFGLSGSHPKEPEAGRRPGRATELPHEERTAEPAPPSEAPPKEAEPVD